MRQCQPQADDMPQLHVIGGNGSILRGVTTIALDPLKKPCWETFPILRGGT